MSAARPLKPIAFFFPQFHAIPENDRWWGEGFTDWTNVRRAQPLFPGQRQPRIPVGGRYYDQSDPTTLRWQIELAKAHGVAGFCHYHYWFDGKQLLETPTDRVLADRSLDLPFCLAWANETWSRRWDGQDHQILVQQTHPIDRARWRLHFDYLKRFWRDERAVRVGDRPVFVIYRAARIPALGAMLDYWRTLASAEGIRTPYFIAMHQYGPPPLAVYALFDAVIQFQPFVSMLERRHKEKPWSRRLVDGLVDHVPLDDGRRRALRLAIEERRGPTHVDYDVTWRDILDAPPYPGLVTYPGAFMDWDNTPRYRNRATIFDGASPERFEHWFGLQAERVLRAALPEPMVFVNAWNEWAEGTYLEPDTVHGMAYLEALARVVRGSAGSLVEPSSLVRAAQQGSLQGR